MTETGRYPTGIMWKKAERKKGYHAYDILLQIVLYIRDEELQRQCAVKQAALYIFVYIIGG